MSTGCRSVVCNYQHTVRHGYYLIWFPDIFADPFMNTVYQNILGLIWTYLYHVYVVVLYFSFVLFLLLFLHAPMKYNVKGIWPCVTRPSLLTDGIYCYNSMMYYAALGVNKVYRILSHLISSHPILSYLPNCRHTTDSKDPRIDVDYIDPTLFCRSMSNRRRSEGLCSLGFWSRFVVFRYV